MNIRNTYTCLISNLWVFFLLCFTSHLYSQSWTKKLPIRGVPVKMINTQDGGYLLLARTDFVNFTYNKISLIKCDANGDTLWMKKFAPSDTISNTPSDMIECGNGDFVIVGRVAWSATSGYLLRTNGQGDTLWYRTNQPNDTVSNRFHTVLELPTKDFFVLGGLGDYSGQGDWYIHKYDSSGNLLTIYTNEHFVLGGHHLRMDASNISPIITKSNFGQNIFRSDYDLIHLSDRYYSSMAARAVAPTADGGFVYYLNSLTKIDSNLDSVWSKSSQSEYGLVSGDHTPRDVTLCSDGGFALCGSFKTYVGPDAVYLIKTDSTGAKMWDQGYYGAVIDNVTNVVQAPDGGFVMFTSGNPDSTNVPEMWLVKTAPDGVISTNEPAPPDALRMLRLSPNPARDRVIVELPEPASGRLELYDTMGRQVRAEKLNRATRKEITTESLPPGIYGMIFINETTGERFMEKFIKISTL